MEMTYIRILTSLINIINKPTHMHNPHKERVTL